MTLEELRQHRSEILALASNSGARNVRIFGSLARGDDRPDSDLDIVVDMGPGRGPAGISLCVSIWRKRSAAVSI